MIALILVTCQTRNCSTRDFFRAAYMRKFGKDISFQSLSEDVEIFEKVGNAPPYVCEYIVGIYGAH